MKISNSQPIWLPPNAPKRAEKALVEKSLMAPSSVASPAILFGKRKSTSSPSKTAPQDLKLAAEMERLTQRAPKLFGTPFVPKDLRPLLKKRALYNLKPDQAVLTECLPYRQILTQKNDQEVLKQYDQLVEIILDKAEFYEMKTLKPSKNAVNKLYELQDGFTEEQLKKYGIDTLWKFMKLFLSFPFNNQARNTLFKIYWGIMQDSAKKISDQNLLKQLSQSGVKPLQDDSTRYLIASSITELLFKNPEQSKQLLNNSKHPVRFIVGKDHALLSQGQFKPGFNLIFLNEESLWRQASKGRGYPVNFSHIIAA